MLLSPRILACGCAILVPASVGLAQSEQKEELPRLLVMPLSAEASLAKSARALDEMVLQAAHDLNKYKVMGHEDLNALLGVEALKDAMGCDDVSCAAEIGGALGAPYLLAGKLTSLGKQAVLSLRLMDTQAPAVMARGTARGEPTGDNLIRMMAQAFGACFEVKLDAGAPTAVTAAPTGMPDYSEYTKIMNDLGRRMANNEYTKMLADLETYEKRAGKIAVPPNTNLAEYLVFYRVTACNMLKRIPCLRKAAKVYMKRWPNGMYASSIQGYLDQVEDAELARKDKTQELEKRLAEIEAGRAKGTFDARTVLEMQAYAYYSAQRYREAAAHFKKLLKLLADNPEKQMDAVQSLVMALEQDGKLAEAREVLERFQKAHPRLFRRKGLHQTLRRLPK